MVWTHLEVPWYLWDLYIVIWYLTAKVIWKLLVGASHRGGRHVTIQHGIRCWHCKQDVWPEMGKQSRCTCGRTFINPAGESTSPAGIRIQRIVPSK